MKRNSTLIFLLLCSSLCFAQPKKFSYLVVEINQVRPDFNVDNPYYTIDSQDSSFTRLHRLREHNPKKEVTFAFFYDQQDNTQAKYNCFRSVNEALFFLGEDGWELVSVNNTIQTEGGVRPRIFDRDIPYTQVTAKPIYYFKKPLGE